jgi:rfaE bifunctional protein kinase chain/domain
MPEAARKKGCSSLNEQAAAIRAAAAAGARISFVSGNFNIVHPGHLRLLKLAADTADILVVGLTPDSTPGVTVPSAMRVDGVRALSIVHHAFVLDGNVAEFVAALQPDFVVKGKEFENAHNPEAAVVESYGGKLVFSSGDVQFASMDLLRQELSPAIPLPLLRGAEGFPERHGLTTRALHNLLNKIPGMRVAVIGDIIVDDYIMCDPLGMSHEDPTIVVSPIETHTFVGGAGIVSAHASSLGAEAMFFTVFGADDTAAYASNALESLNVKVHGIVDETRPTTRKQRYRALDKTLLRVSHLRQHAISKQLAETMRNDIVAILPQVDLLMFSDFNYGCLPQEMVESIVAAARDQGVLMTADSQASSQMANIARFKGMTLITPTEREARLALRDNASGLAVLTSDLREAAAAENVLITLGEDGMMVHGRNRDREYVTDRLPALNATPKDVAGAGDSVFTCASMALCSGADIWLASYLGGIAAAIQVSRIGNTPIDVKDIRFEINQIDNW